jgi:fucose permease
MTHFKIKLSLFLNYFVFAILLNSVGTVILQVQNNFSISKGAASNLEAFKDLSIALASFLVASFVIRIGYKKAMLIALGLVAVMCAVMPSAGSFAATKMLFAVTGVSFALIKVTTFATLGIVTRSKKEHLSLMNFLESFFMIGVLAGYFIFAFFVDDNNPRSTRWFNVYYLLSALSVLAFLLLLFAPLDETEVRKAELAESRSLADDFLGMLKLIILPLVLVFIFSAFFSVLIEQSIMSWLPTFNKDVLNLSTTLSIIMASIMSASIALGRFLAGILLRRVDWIIVLTGCLLAAGALVLLTVPMANNVPAISVNKIKDVPMVAYFFPLIGLFLAPVYPAINSIILNTLPKHKHGAMSGLIVVFSALGGTTGSIITGHIFGAYGGQTAMYLSLIPIGILIILLFFFKRLQRSSPDQSAGMKMTAGH